MKRKILLGATEDGTIVFANVEIRERNGERLFSASFDEVRPVEVTDEYLRERVEVMLEGMNKDDLFSMLEDYDCRPSELVDYFIRDQLWNYGVEGILDISLYPESFSVEGYEDEIYFESDSCGQHDTRDVLIPIDPEFSEWLHSLWDTYHLKQLTDDEVDNVIKRIEEYEDEVGDIEEWIQNWLEEEWS
jgi:hypothetical protein